MAAVLEVREPRARYLDAPKPAVMRQFEVLATAPQSVARLRELILTLAVQGKLVRQDVSDEPASQLLGRLRAEKNQLVARGRAARARPIDPVSDDETPFALPLGWVWARLPEICYDLGQQVPTGDFTYIDVGSINNERACITDDVRVLRAGDAPSRARKLVKQGTVLYSTVRPYLKNIAIVERDYAPGAIASTAFAVMHPHTGVDAKYLLYYLRSDLFTQFVESKMVGVAYPAINEANFYQGVIALPPAAEQARIVARVDELMRLCDALEAKGRLEAEQHAILPSVLLGTLSDSRSPEELAANWQRVADHFDLLFDRPEAVDAVEQKVFDWAVRGLLTQSAGGVHGPNSANRGDADERHRLPVGWTSVRVGDVVQMLNGYAFKSDWFEKSGVRLLRNVNVSHGHLNWEQPAFISEVRAADLAQFSLREGDLVLTLDRPLISTGLKFARVRRSDLPCLLLQRVARLQANADVLSPDFLVIWLQSNQFVGVIDPGRSNGVPHISTKQVASLAFDLPPLSEQHRIVARVTQLRGLCAELRQRLAASRVTQARLADVLIESVTAA